MSKIDNNLSFISRRTVAKEEEAAQGNWWLLRLLLVKQHGECGRVVHLSPQNNYITV
jgi:hypothetical protein